MAFREGIYTRENKGETKRAKNKKRHQGGWLKILVCRAVARDKKIFFTVYVWFILLVSFFLSPVLFLEYLYITMHFSFFDSVLAGGGTFDLCLGPTTSPGRPDD